MPLCVSAVLGTVLLMVSFGTAYAEPFPQSGSLHVDLENDPIAQEILKNIELSKRWLENLQNKNIEQEERRQEMEAKRSQAIRTLEVDLKKWQDLWNDYTFDHMLERALIETMPGLADTIYDHPLKFTASKINSGREALSRAIQNGAGAEEARDAFVNAAKVTRVEMVTANALYNIMMQKAYYNQQILFEPDGTFDLDLSGDKLRLYYEDYRTIPEYLLNNPYDTASWDDLSESDLDTVCRDGYILIHRDRTDDYLCITEYAAEMWVRHGMGNPVEGELDMVPDDLTGEQLHRDRIEEKVSSINGKIHKVHDDHRFESDDVMQKYDAEFMDLALQQSHDERIAENRHSRGEISAADFDIRMNEISEKYEIAQEILLKEKLQSVDTMRGVLRENLDTLVSKYEHDSEIRITWNDQNETYHVETDAVPDDPAREQLHRDRIEEKVSGINGKIHEVHEDYLIQSDRMTERYDTALLELDVQEMNEEKIVINKHSRGQISTDNFDVQMIDIREKYDVVEKNIQREQEQSTEALKNTLRENLDILVSKYEYDSEVLITWNDQNDTYHAETDV